MQILLVEDDPVLSNDVALSLSAEGHAVDVIADGQEAFRLARTGRHHLLIADRMVPGMDGMSLVRALRAEECVIPILFLTALDGLYDRVAGLDAGGDDYLVKPFAMAELVARVAALGRRGRDQATQLVCGDLVLDRLQRSVMRAGHPIILQPREFALLEYLMRHEGAVVTRAMLLKAVWGINFDPGTNVVESHLSRLRARIDRPYARPLIHTVRGGGYRIGDD